MKKILLFYLLSLTFCQEHDRIHQQIINFCNSLAHNIAKIKVDELDKVIPSIIGQQVKSIQIENIMDIKCNQGEYLLTIQAKEIIFSIEIKGFSSNNIEKITIQNPKIQTLLFSEQDQGIIDIRVFLLDLEAVKSDSWFIDQLMKMNGIVKEGIRFMAKAKQNQIRESINYQIATKLSQHLKPIFNFINNQENPQKWIEKTIQLIPNTKLNGKDLIVQLSNFKIDL